MRELLAEELGVDPAPETRALHEELLREDPAPARLGPPPRGAPWSGGPGSCAAWTRSSSGRGPARGPCWSAASPGSARPRCSTAGRRAPPLAAPSCCAAGAEEGELALQPVLDALAGRLADVAPDEWAAGTRAAGAGRDRGRPEPAGLRAPRRRRPVAARGHGHRAGPRRRRRRGPGDLGLAGARTPAARAPAAGGRRAPGPGGARRRAGHLPRRAAAGRRRGRPSWSGRPRRGAARAQRRQPAPAHRARPRRRAAARRGVPGRCARRWPAGCGVPARPERPSRRPPSSAPRSTSTCSPRCSGRRRWTCSSTSTWASGRRSLPSGRVAWRSGTSWSGSRWRPAPARPGGPGCTGAPPSVLRSPDRTRRRSTWPGTPARAATGRWRPRDWRTPPSVALARLDLAGAERLLDEAIDAPRHRPAAAAAQPGPDDPRRPRRRRRGRRARDGHRRDRRGARAAGVGRPATGTTSTPPSGWAGPRPPPRPTPRSGRSSLIAVAFGHRGQR